MLKNYFKTIFRNAGRNPGYSFINVAGLAVGLATCLIIGLFVQSELSYDRFHADANLLYRVVQYETEGDGLTWSGPQMGLKLMEDFPQIETAMRLIDGSGGYGSQALISYEDESSGQINRFNEDGFIYADPDFFRFFTFPLVFGSTEDVLNRPGTVVISATAAQKYFGNDNPVGKILILENRFPLEVTGVFEDPPQNSHLKFDYVASFRTFYANRGIPGEVNSFWWPPTHTYIKLQPAASAFELNEQLPEFAFRHRDADDASRLAPQLQPLNEIWLGPDFRGQQQAGGSVTYVYLFSAIALFILLLACVNFINLSTARATKRAKEVGIRKTAGADRKQLVAQFLTESALLSFVAMILAIFLVELLLPIFNTIASRELGIPYDQILFWQIIVVITVITGCIAGAYPALYLSRFRPAWVLKSNTGHHVRGSGIRKSLVVFQFTVSIVLLAGTAIVYQQLQYVNQARMGFDEQQVVILPGISAGSDSEEQRANRLDTFRSELLGYPEVNLVSVTSNRPGSGSGNIYVWEAEGLQNDPSRQFPVQFVGEDFFQMLDTDIIAGRPLRADDPADIGSSRLRTTAQNISTLVLENRAIVINETAADQMGWTLEEAIGKQMRFYITENDNIYQDYLGTVVGVVEDYHTASLHEPIGPVAYSPVKHQGGNYLTMSNILVQFAPGTIDRVLDILNQTWSQFVPEQPLEAEFMDESISALYQSEIRMGKLITAFTILAVFIACLGLFGLAAHTAESRTKEIGIRKVLGAKTHQIVTLLSVDFVKLALAGFVIAIPIGLIFANHWLQNFVYRVDIGWQVFAWTGAVALVLALITVSSQSVKAALMNPVKSLRSE